MTDGTGPRRGAHRAGRRPGADPDEPPGPADGDGDQQPARHWPDRPYPRASWLRRTLARPLARPIDSPLLRSVGYSALAVLLVSGLIAVVWAVSGDQGGPAAAPSPAASTSPAATSRPAPTTAPASPPPTRTPATGTPRVRPAPSTTRPAQPPPATTPPVTVLPLLVLNNSRVGGLAAKAAADFHAAGWPVAGTGNLTGRIATTTAYYGTGQYDAARALAARFPAIARVLPRPAGVPGGAALTVVVTRYYPH